LNLLAMHPIALVCVCVHVCVCGGWVGGVGWCGGVHVCMVGGYGVVWTCMFSVGVDVFV